MAKLFELESYDGRQIVLHKNTKELCVSVRVSLDYLPDLENRTTCHLDLLKGNDQHHSWESAFHAMGEALRNTLAENPWRVASHNPYYGEEGIADASLLARRQIGRHGSGFCRTGRVT